MDLRFTLKSAEIFDYLMSFFGVEQGLFSDQVEGLLSKNAC
jgi:hypothetical protein